MSNSGQLLPRYPEKFSNQHLANHATTTASPGNIVATQNGCAGGNFTNQSYAEICKAGGFSYPNNGEYDFEDFNNGWNTPREYQCNYCSAPETITDGCDPDPKTGPGPQCQCTGYGWTSTGGQRCAVKRIAFNGSAAGCCMLKTSPFYSPSKGTTTGWAKGRGSINQWQSLTNDTYTCDPNVLFDCSQSAQAVAEVCSRNMSNPNAEVYSAWNKRSKQNDAASSGMCYGYAKNVVGNNTGAKGTVLTAALNGIANVPNMGFGKQNVKHATAINNMLELCSETGGCDGALSNICTNYTYNDVLSAYQNYLNASDKTTAEAVANKNLYQACGCHLQPEQYGKWSNLGVSTTCDPVCMIPGVVPEWTAAGPKQCEQNLCIIDNVKIDIINSNAGDITFNEVCGGCGNNGSGCRCVFSGINVFESGSSVGNINFSQNCGGSCQIPDANNPGNFIPINCATGIPTGNVPIGGSTWDAVKKWASSHQFELVVLVAAFITALVMFFMWLNKKPMLPKVPSIGNKITLADLFGQYADF